MNTIKFSKEYGKLWGQRKAKLVHVDTLLGKTIHPDLIEYDTKAVDGSYYGLSDGWLLELVFLGDKGIPFCTLRSYSPEKEDYYRGCIGQRFEIVRTWEATS